jgi:hypothetical protein
VPHKSAQNLIQSKRKEEQLEVPEAQCQHIHANQHAEDLAKRSCDLFICNSPKPDPIKKKIRTIRGS